MLSLPGVVYAKQSPAADYCVGQGYEYRIYADTDGNEHDICLKDGQIHDAWELYGTEKTRQIRMFSAPIEAKIALPLVQNRTTEQPTLAAPPILDWRSHNGNNYISPIKNQGLCGGCWAFSGIGVAEAAVKINLDMPDYALDLSEQHQVSCNHLCFPGFTWPDTYCQGGCSGGYSELTFRFLDDTGAIPESCFPYTGNDNNCNNKCADWANMLTRFDTAALNPGQAKQTIATYGPIDAIIRACDAFDSYHGGILVDDVNTGCGWHGVAIVGYNDTGQYWIAKNSWGIGWGESGFFRIAYSETVYDYADYVDWLEDVDDTRILFLHESYAIVSTNSDSDAILDGIDNCPFVTNPSQLDTDSDGAGNECDDDDDNDGIIDALDDCPLIAGLLALLGCPDQSLPVIDQVNISDTIIRSGTVVDISVAASDNVGIRNITADGMALVNISGIWTGSRALASSPLEIVASDFSGNIATVDVPYIIDDMPPSIDDIVLSKEVAAIGQIVNISFSISEDNYYNSSVHVGNRTAALVFDDGGAFIYSYTIVADDPTGPNAVNISVLDAAGNNATASAALMIDKETPVITFVITAPSVIRTNGSLHVTANIIDGNLLSVSANSQLLSCSTVEDNNECSGNITIDRDHVYILAIDQAGQSQYTNVSISLDDVLPVINNITLSRQIAQTGMKVNVTINATDNHGLNSIMLDGMGFVESDGYWHLQINAIKTQYSVYAIDNATNEIMENFSIMIDDTQPVVTHSLNSTANNGWHDGPVRLSLEAEDENGMGVIQYRLTGGPWLTYSGEIDVNIPGRSIILYRAKDLAENIAPHKDVTIEIDPFSPNIDRLDFPDESPPGYSFSAYALVSDILSGISNVSLSINGSEEIILEENGGYFSAETVAPSAPGSYTALLMATDLTGNIAILSQNFTVSPDHTIVNPVYPNGSFLSAGTMLEFRLGNHDEAYINTSGNLSLTADTYSTVLDEPVFWVNITLERSGQNHTYDYVYYLDSLPPTLSVTGFSNANGTLDAGANCTDAGSGARNISLFVDDILYGDFDDGVDTLLLGDGEHEFRFICFDNAGNNDTVAFNATINNTKVVLPVIDGYAVFDQTHYAKYLKSISGINSSIEVSMEVLKETAGKPAYVKHEMMHLNITADVFASSKVFFTLPEHDGTAMYWVKHNSSGYDGPYTIQTFGDHYFFTTPHFSEFIIGIQYDACGEGVVGESCICQGSVRSSGYCCGGAWQSSTCNPQLSNPGGSGKKGGGAQVSAGIMPVKKEVEQTIKVQPSVTKAFEGAITGITYIGQEAEINILELEAIGMQKMESYLQFAIDGLFNATNISIIFKVPDDWAGKNISLLAGNGGTWVEMPIQYVSEKEGFVYYQALIEKAERYAIVAEVQAQAIEPVQEEVSEFKQMSMPEQKKTDGFFYAPLILILVVAGAVAIRKAYK